MYLEHNFRTLCAKIMMIGSICFELQKKIQRPFFLRQHLCSFFVIGAIQIRDDDDDDDDTW